MHVYIQSHSQAYKRQWTPWLILYQHILSIPSMAYWLLQRWWSDPIWWTYSTWHLPESYIAIPVVGRYTILLSSWSWECCGYYSWSSCGETYLWCIKWLSKVKIIIVSVLLEYWIQVLNTGYSYTYRICLLHLFMCWCSIGYYDFYTLVLVVCVCYLSSGM